MVKKNYQYANRLKECVPMQQCIDAFLAKQPFDRRFPSLWENWEIFMGYVPVVPLSTNERTIIFGCEVALIMQDKIRSTYV